MSAFSAGEKIAQRYRVVRFLARGGMGEVYEVEDLELHSRVALKTLRGELSRDEKLLERFRREVNLARRVTHPNVCRIFDLGFHESGDGRVPFLTMELCEGESLRARLERGGRLSTEAALPIVRQLAAALEAAHAIPVIHRDLKSDNVMLVPVPDGVRAVITDFGLARALDTPESAPDRLQGTPAYMAPEQVLGRAAGPATDLYSLGVVIYEMVTGALPFEGDNPIAIATARLNAKPIPPRRRVPTLDRRWERVILRCLERAPERRFARAADVVAALTDPSIPVAARSWRWPAVAMAIALAGGGVGYWKLRPRASRPSVVANLGLRNASGRPEAAWLGTALSELLSSELSAGGAVRSVPAERVTRLQRELGLHDGEALPSEARALGRATLDADWLLSGSYVATPDGKLRVDLALENARTGERLKESELGGEAELFALAARAGGRLRADLGAGAPTPAQLDGARASLPADPAAARFYAEGLDRLRRLDALGAQPLLYEATRTAPDFPLAHAALADASRRLGHDEAQVREAELAFAHADRLSREEQLAVEATLRVAKREWPRAIELYRTLCDFFPGSLDYGLALAHTQSEAGRGPDALATLDRLRREIPAAAQDPRVPIEEAVAHELLGEFPAEDRAARAAVEQARKIGARELEGDALLHQSYAASQVGDRARAAEAAEQALALFRKIGNRTSAATALRIKGGVDWKRGELEKARDELAEAVAIFRELGDGVDLARALQGYAGVESDLGDNEQAMRSYREALPLFERAADPRGLASTHLNLGQQLHHAHRLDEAQAELEKGLELARSIGKRNYEAISLESLGSLAIDLGELSKAIERERQAIEVASRIEDVTTVAQAGSLLGAALADSGQSEAGIEELRKAIASLDRLGERGRLAYAQVKLGRVMLALGRGDEAEELARKAVELHQSAGVRTGESNALLARVLVRSKRTAEARLAIDRALTAERTLDVESAAAEVERAEGQAESALTRLQDALSLPALPVGDRLAAELERASCLEAVGRDREADATRRSVAHEANEKGFAALARALRQ